MKELLPILLPPLSLIAGWVGRLLMERRMRDATAMKTEAEAKVALASAEKTLADAGSVEAKVLADVIGIYRGLYEDTEKRLTALEAEREGDRKLIDALQEKVKMLETRLARYRTTVGQLVKQLQDHGLEPVVRPDEEINGGK
jgi:hypothetical protein